MQKGPRYRKIPKTRISTLVKLIEAAVNVMHLYIFTANAGKFIITQGSIYNYLECNWRWKATFFVDS
jgi:hypothetical protein